ncbi:arsenate reductase (glutaredoxin) [Alteromonas sp. ASW11-19]|uniref:Arsenate reductase n=1 Tax=Alteromonas salexigens TaxID=2982530 RepID=A0ABT2VL73_9ALTE|nr:arsenate reductase (glutaredoxin) [Alteromonas salexigens]MCU7554060.1 arsenate reductase (glutaredoxin) [Alteromonas salexigens]
MSSITLIHNPRCSKSRQTLALLQEHGIVPNVLEYLKTPLDEESLRAIFSKLPQQQVIEMVRTKEAEFKDAGLSKTDSSDDALFAAMAAYPKLIERPIVINDDKARIGRPPEAVLEII